MGVPSGGVSVGFVRVGVPVFSGARVPGGGFVSLWFYYAGVFAFCIGLFCLFRWVMVTLWGVGGVFRS